MSCFVFTLYNAFRCYNSVLDNENRIHTFKKGSFENVPTIGIRSKSVGPVPYLGQSYLLVRISIWDSRETISPYFYQSLNWHAQACRLLLHPYKIFCATFCYLHQQWSNLVSPLWWSNLGSIFQLWFLIPLQLVMISGSWMITYMSSPPYGGHLQVIFIFHIFSKGCAHNSFPPFVLTTIL